MRIVFLLLFCWLWGLPALAADSCNAGYFVNDVGECEICPGGYYCSDGVKKDSCPGMSGFEEYEKIGVIGIAGATSVYECGVSYVPPGYYVRGNGYDAVHINSCSVGNYCPGIDYDVRAKDINEDINNGDGGIGSSVGLVSCGLAYSKEGATSADDCVPCPEYEDKNYHYAGFMMPVVDIDGIEACGFLLAFGDKYIVSTFSMLLEALSGVSVSLSPSYQPGHVNNTRGGVALVIKYDVTKRRYVVDVDQSQIIACGAGYFAPLASGQLPEGFVLPEWVFYEVPPVQDYLEFMCAPVGENAYSPGYEFDMNTMEVVNDGLAWYACPDGTYSAGYGVGADEESDCCVAGFRSYGGACLQMCDAGVRYLKTSVGVSVPLFATKPTERTLNIKYGNGKVCYAGAEVGRKSGAINLLYDGVTYHLVD